MNVPDQTIDRESRTSSGVREGTDVKLMEMGTFDDRTVMPRPSM